MFYIMSDCLATTTVATCNDCQKLCRSTFSTCWRCHKTDICEDCITTLTYDDNQELCTLCNEAHKKKEEERYRAYQEQRAKEKAEHKRNWPHLF